MSSLRIAGVELEPWEITRLKELWPTGIFSEHRLDDAGDLGDPEALIVFIYSAITAETLAKLPHLKLIATMSTGFDHIDLAACQARGVTVCNVPTYGENTVAEHALALLLALSRNVVPSVNHTRHGDFRLDGLRGTDLAGKTAGVVGTGRIGRRFIAMAKGLAMNVVAYDLMPQPAVAKELGFTYVDLETLLKTSDAVSLHAPATKETFHLLNAERLMLMKPTAFLVNTARGTLIETQGLVAALQAGKLAGVGLDVLEEECVIREERELLSKAFQQQCDLRVAYADHLLLEHPRVIITPHNAFNSHEALLRILNTTITNVTAFQSGQSVNTVK